MSTPAASGNIICATACAVAPAAIDECETTTTAASEALLRRQTSLGDYFPAELAVKPSTPQQQQHQGKRRQQQHQPPPPRHRLTRPSAAAASVGSHADDSGCCDIAELEEQKLRDCLALAFTASSRQQQQQHQQQQLLAPVSATAASQVFNDSFGLAKLAADVDRNAAAAARDGADCCETVSLSSSSSTSSSVSSSAPSSLMLLPTSPSGDELDDADDGVAAAAAADVRVKAAFGDEEEELFRGCGSLFESSMFSADSPSDIQHQHRFVDGAWRRRSSGGSGDDRELFVGNLAAEVTNEDLVRIFSEFGQLRSVGIAKDSASGACKGFGFLSFQKPELAEAVLESPRLFTLYGRVLRVDWRLKSAGHHSNGSRRLSSPRQSNYQPQAQHPLLLDNGPSSTVSDESPTILSTADDDAGRGAGNFGDCQLFVGNLASDVTQGDLRQYFRRWGELLYCYVIRDEDGQSKRYGFITFKDPKVADQLMQSRSSHVLKGKRLRFEMPKRSREEAFSLRQQDASSSTPSSTKTSGTASTTTGGPAATPTVAIKPGPTPSADQSPVGLSLPVGLENTENLPLWLHVRLMSDKEQLILCLRKELGLCGLLAERRMREINQVRDREAQVMRVYLQQLEARVKSQSAELDSLRHQLECRGEQVKLLTAKTEALAVEIVKAWGCAAATAAAATNTGGRKDDGASAAAAAAAAAPGAVAQQQQHHLFHHQHRLRPDSGIGL